jgi:hypothetical protein
MPDFIYDIPNDTLAAWFSLAAISAMVFGLLVIKPLFRLLIGTGPDFNASVNYATSGFGLFYGLLLGLLTVAAYQNSERLRESIMKEATALGPLYTQVNAFPEPDRSIAKEMMRDYVLYTIYKEWPAHREGEILNGGHNRADAIFVQLAGFEPQTEGERTIHAAVISSYQDFSAARQQRLAGVITKIPAVLWYAVLVGAAINLLLIVLLRIRLAPHFVLGSITAFFLGVILFVIVTLDRPLRGPNGLDPVPLKLLWERSMVWDEPVR